MHGTMAAMEKMTAPEVRRFTEVAPAILRVFEEALNSVFDDQGARWSELKLRVGAAMSAVELALNTRLQPRRAAWHACMVLMTLRDLDGGDPSTTDMLATVAAVAHTVSLAAIACDSEVASPESVRQARTFLEALGSGPPDYARLVAAHRATG